MALIHLPVGVIDTDCHLGHLQKDQKMIVPRVRACIHFRIFCKKTGDILGVTCVPDFATSLFVNHFDRFSFKALTMDKLDYELVASFDLYPDLPFQQFLTADLPEYQQE